MIAATAAAAHLPIASSVRRGGAALRATRCLSHVVYHRWVGVSTPTQSNADASPAALRRNLTAPQW